MDPTSVDYFAEVQRMSEMIYNYGIMVVISGIFLVLVILLMIIGIRRWQSKTKQKAKDNESILQSILEQNNALVAKITDAANKVSEAPKKESKDIVVQTFLNHKIIDAMSLTREMIKADRIDCYLFANGNSSLSGAYRFFRFVRTFSAIRKGSKAAPLTEMPLSFLPSIFTRLANDKLVSIWDLEELQADNSVALTWLEQSDAKAAVFSLIKESDSPSGFIVALYEEPYDSEDLREEVETRVNNLAIKVGVLIDTDTNKEE